MVEHFILSGFYERCSECSSCLRRKKIACSTRNDRVAECTSLLGGDGEEMERIGNFCKPKKIKSKQIKSKQSTKSYKETENAFSAPLFVPISATARAWPRARPWHSETPNGKFIFAVGWYLTKSCCIRTVPN